jgi:HEAT repeat protein
MSQKIILFQPQKHLLDKSRCYIDDLELFMDESDIAVPLLLKALRHADRQLKHRIILLLGGFAKEEIAWPLFEMMTDTTEDEAVRHDASIQLSVTMPFLKQPQALVDRLLGVLKSTEPELRAYAAFALGWKGNAQAAISLIELLYDPDPLVQQAAVNALANLQDDRIFGLLVERLEYADLEQRRSIIYNLWRFAAKHPEAATVYLRSIDSEEDELRFDALVLLGLISNVRDHLAVYRKCMKDNDPKIRELALHELAALSPSELAPLRGEIEAGLNDPDMAVKRAAIEFLKKI